MDFYYMHGCGNRFAIFDGRSDSVNFSGDDIRCIASSEADSIHQVIVMESSRQAAVFVRIWNRDGSQAEACGNAVRCVAWLLMRERGNSEPIFLETVAGLLRAESLCEDRISVDMGVPLLGWEEIPLSERMDTRGIDLKIGPLDNPFLHSPGAVNMGNPHAVFFVKDLGHVDVEAVGPLVEGHMLFPRGVNAGFAQILSEEAIGLQVWERGAGLTPACGTGACAALVAACRKGLSGRRARIDMDGGSLQVHWREQDDHVIMSGAVEFISMGRI